MKIIHRKQHDYKIHYNGTFYHVYIKVTVLAAFKYKEHAEIFINLLKAEKEIFERIMKELK